MEDEKKNAELGNQESPVVSQEEILEEVNHDIEGQTAESDNDEVTPTIIKKLHRRQVSTASAKMFAINEDIFRGDDNSSFATKNDISKIKSKSLEQNSKEVKFDNIKGDSGISRSVERSDIDQTSDTQITSGIGTVETGFETVGTSRSSINKGKSREVPYAKLKGNISTICSIKFIFFHTKNIQFTIELYPLIGWKLVLTQISGLLQKRWLHTIKDYKFIISSLILPCLMLAISMLLPILSRNHDNEAIILSPSLYGPESASFVK